MSSNGSGTDLATGKAAGRMSFSCRCGCDVSLPVVWSRAKSCAPGSPVEGDDTGRGWMEEGRGKPWAGGRGLGPPGICVKSIRWQTSMWADIMSRPLPGRRRRDVWMPGERHPEFRWSWQSPDMWAYPRAGIKCRERDRKRRQALSLHQTWTRSEPDAPRDRRHWVPLNRLQTACPQESLILLRRG